MSSTNVVLVIGAAGGIGTALCRRLAKRGVALAVAGRDAARLEALAAEVGGGRCARYRGSRCDRRRDVIGTNLTTAFALIRAAAPAIGRGGGGSIVLASSAAARIGLANHDA